jgi:hypothetical protein
MGSTPQCVLRLTLFIPLSYKAPPIGFEIVCPLTGKLRGSHVERYGALWS